MKRRTTKKMMRTMAMTATEGLRAFYRYKTSLHAKSAVTERTQSTVMRFSGELFEHCCLFMNGSIGMSECILQLLPQICFIPLLRLVRRLATLEYDPHAALLYGIESLLSVRRTATVHSYIRLIEHHAPRSASTLRLRGYARIQWVTVSHCLDVSQPVPPSLHTRHSRLIMYPLSTMLSSALFSSSRALVFIHSKPG